MSQILMMRFRSLLNLSRTVTRRRASRSVEGLEDRTLLATLVGANKVTYQDSDGDNVTVTFSKSFLTPANVNSVFLFNFQTVDGNNTAATFLREINLTGIAAAAGTTITTVAVRSTTTGGDGFATLGQILATGLDLGAVTVDGDLGRILAGDATTTTQGLGALKVHSIGRYGTLTGAVDLNSVIQGKLASLTTKSDVKGALIDVQGGANGQIGTVTIGGSLLDGSLDSEGNMGAVTVAGDVIRTASGGRISSDGKLASATIGGSLILGRLISGGDMGAVSIAGDIDGNTLSDFSGSVFSNGKLASVTIGGSLIGGYGGAVSSGYRTGSIVSALDIGPVTIKGDVNGNNGNFGGTYNATESGFISSTMGKLASVTIGGSLLGGNGTNSGTISSALDMGAVKVTGDIANGRVFSGGKLASATIGGSLLGGSAQSKGQLFSELDMGPVSIAGSVIGGDYDAPFQFDATGAIVSNGKIGNVTIGGALKGGTGDFSGLVWSGTDLGAVKVSGDVIGTEGLETGRIQSFSGKIASVTINGALKGGSGGNSGVIGSTADMGPVKVLGNVSGGGGLGSGRITVGSGAKLASVFIGGSLIGGTNSNSGRISGGLELTTLTIQGNIVGGSASGSTNLEQSGHVQADRIGTLTLNGSLIAGSDFTSGTFANNGAIRVDDDIANATIKGSLIGNTTNKAVISARGRLAPSGTTDLAIGKLTISGRVEYASILAGVDLLGIARNADAQIGPVIVGLDWIASDLVAGATTGADAFFGNGNDAKMAGGSVKDVANVSSKITSIVIGGQVLGTTSSNTDHFGFVAENIGSFKVKGGTTTFPMVSGNGNDDFLVTLGFFGASADVRVNEI